MSARRVGPPMRRHAPLALAVLAALAVRASVRGAATATVPPHAWLLLGGGNTTTAGRRAAKGERPAWPSARYDQALTAKARPRSPSRLPACSAAPRAYPAGEQLSTN